MNRTRSWVAGAVAAAALTTACGGGDPSPPAADDAPTTASATPATQPAPESAPTRRVEHERRCAELQDPQPLSVLANDKTSCGFAANVAHAALGDVQTAKGPFEVLAYSPALDRKIAMTCTVIKHGISCTGGDHAAVRLVESDTDSAPAAAADEAGPGPNEAAPDAPSQTAGSKALRRYLRRVGNAMDAPWAGSIDEDETVLTVRAGAAAAITVNGTPTEADVRQVCAVAMGFRDDMAFATVSDQDGTVDADC